MNIGIIKLELLRFRDRVIPSVFTKYSVFHRVTLLIYLLYLIFRNIVDNMTRFGK